MIKKFLSYIAFQPTINYLKETSILKMIIQSVIILIVSITLASTYVFSTNFDYFIEILYNKVQVNTDIRKQIENTIRINYILEELIRNLELSSRAYIFEYHNGIKGVTGLPFLFQSNTHEVVKPGISSEINNLQNLPLNLSPERLELFLERKCFSHEVLYGFPRTAFDQLLSQQGIVFIATCPIFSKNGILLGFVGVDFNDSIPENIERIFQLLKNSALKTKKYIEG